MYTKVKIRLTSSSFCNWIIKYNCDAERKWTKMDHRYTKIELNYSAEASIYEKVGHSVCGEIQLLRIKVRPCSEEKNHISVIVYHANEKPEKIREMAKWQKGDCRQNCRRGLFYLSSSFPFPRRGRYYSQNTTILKTSTHIARIPEPTADEMKSS